mmetsp:Transcript_12731/g.19144  ORF Transcript_12731/g.19144 Transcript_12731/m.19144 type:complete len:188 (-) Transcript_12731:709-1272(-)
MILKRKGFFKRPKTRKEKIEMIDHLFQVEENEEIKEIKKQIETNTIPDSIFGKLIDVKETKREEEQRLEGIRRRRRMNQKKQLQGINSETLKLISNQLEYKITEKIEDGEEIKVGENTPIGWKSDEKNIPKFIQQGAFTKFSRNRRKWENHIHEQLKEWNILPNIKQLNRRKKNKDIFKKRKLLTSL